MYRYKCDNCGHEVLILRDFNDNSDVYCEKCGSEMKKLIGRVSVVFKSSGFYTTDVKKKTKSAEDAKSTKRTTSESEVVKSSEKK